MPKVAFTNEVKQIEVPSGTTLLDACSQAGVNPFRGLWPGLRCHGAFPLNLVPWGACGRCRIWVRGDAADAVNPPTRRERLHPKLSGSFRLACQVRVRGDLGATTRPNWE